MGRDDNRPAGECLKSSIPTIWRVEMDAMKECVRQRITESIRHVDGTRTLCFTRTVDASGLVTVKCFERWGEYRATVALHGIEAEEAWADVCEHYQTKTGAGQMSMEIVS